VRELIPGARESAGTSSVQSSVQMIRSGALVWLSRTVPGAGRLAPDALQRSVAGAYAELGGAIAATRTSALRLWNYLPDPHDRMGPALDRYMVFNAGRHDGYRHWFDAGSFERSLPTATAVGVAGDDLVVQCLASDAAGHAVQNARQRPPWQYSSRYGPVPPTFSRGTVALVGGRRLVLIGGTASIVGEDSVHIGDPAAQLEETLRNLASVIAEAADAGESLPHSLARLAEMRVYVAREADAPAIYATLRERCAGAARIEMTVAHLCRPELLVEIEGIAELNAAQVVTHR
jgi:chorismate lyase/3-hydroxybenzoate synthase